MADIAKLFSGREMRYATTNHISDNKLPIGTLLENANSDRAKMIVAESHANRFGQLQTMTRNVLADDQLAYGEEPSKTISVGVNTDTNCTGSKVKTLGDGVAITDSAAELKLKLVYCCAFRSINAW